MENKLGLPDFLKGKADVVVTADKEGADSGAAGRGLLLAPKTAASDVCGMSRSINRQCVTRIVGASASAMQSPMLSNRHLGSRKPTLQDL